MNTRWNASTWVLIVLSTLIALTAVDIGRHYVSGFRPTPPPPPVQYDPKFRVGDLAPDFTLPDAKGKKYSLSQVIDRPTILCFTCGCSKCEQFQTYLGALQKKLGDKAPKVITVSTMASTREGTWCRDTHLKSSFLYVSHENAALMQLYKAEPCPRAFELDAKRHVKWISPSIATTTVVEAVMQNTAVHLGFGQPGRRTSANPNPAPPMFALPPHPHLPTAPKPGPGA